MSDSIEHVPFAVQLPRARWDVVMSILAERPWREVNPLLQEIIRQITTAEAEYRVEAARPLPPDRPRVMPMPTKPAAE